MQITIKYEPTGELEYPCCAKTEIDGHSILAINYTYEEAEAELLAKVKAWRDHSSVPEPKTVTL